MEARPLIVHRDRPATSLLQQQGAGAGDLGGSAWQRTYASAAGGLNTAEGNTSFKLCADGEPAQEIKRLCDWLERPLSAEAETLLSSRVDRTLPTQTKETLAALALRMRRIRHRGAAGPPAGRRPGCAGLQHGG